MDNNCYVIDEKKTWLESPIKLQIDKLKLEDVFIEKDPHILLLDLDKVRYPLVLRKWKIGDWFIPFGMNGRKKISDYFSDNKFSLIDKENTWLLCNGDDIVWIVGYRSDDRYKIKQTTKSVLKITLHQ